MMEMKTRHSLCIPKGKVFPCYPESEGLEGPLVTTGRLAKAKWEARHIFRDRLALSHDAFRKYAQRKYRCKPQQVSFDDSGALRRIREAVIMTGDKNYLGETDGVEIRITHMPMSHPLLVGVLIHEAMHDWCKVRGCCMCCKKEHFCMSKVGEIF